MSAVRTAGGRVPASPHEPLLSIERLRVRFGGTLAVDDVRVRQEEQQNAEIEQQRLEQADLQPPRGERQGHRDEAELECDRVRRAHRERTRQPVAALDPLEQRIERDVPPHRDHRYSRRQRPHMHERKTQHPTDDRRADHDRGHFERERVHEALGQRLPRHEFGHLHLHVKLHQSTRWHHFHRINRIHPV